jgi:hypothetical protein
MAISDMVERLGRAVFEAPFGGTRIAKDTPELVEIRLAILAAIKSKSYRAGGRSVVPFDLVRVRLLGVPEQQAAVFRTDFLARYLTEELKSALERSHRRFSDTLHVEVATSPELPEAGKEWINVEIALATPQPAAENTPARRPAKLVVLNARANRAEIPLTKTRTNIGRIQEVFKTTGPSRKNDLSFTEENDVNRSVSREHAHISYSAKADEYRLFNDRVYKGEDNCGLWIVRDSLSQPVHRGSRGTLLQSGDEIHLGSAVLRFQTK